MPWYDGDGAIPSINVIESVELPTAFQEASIGSLTDAWTIAIKTSFAGGNKFAFDSETGRLVLGEGGTVGQNGFLATSWRDIDLFPTDTTDRVYFLVQVGNSVQAYRDNVAVGAAASTNINLGGVTRWGGNNNGGANGWERDIVYGAVYDIALDSTQRDALYASMTDAGAVDEIAISIPTQYQVYQRSGSTGDIVISGTYGGTPTAIEASFNGGSYQTIVASPAGGSFSGTLTNQAGGQGTLTVRFTNDTAINASVTDVGIGDVFLVAGQSNAAGRLTNDQTYSHATLTATMYTEADAWLELADPTEHGGTDGSVWPLLATLIMADQGVPVAFITTAEGSTGLTDGDWAQGGIQYTGALAQVTSSNVPAVGAVLFAQGERDVALAATQSAYQTALSQMLDDMQADNLALANTIMICYCVAHYATEPDANVDAIRAAQIDRWENDADIYPGPTGHDQNLTDGLHWSTDLEAATLAGRWFRTIAAAMYGGSESARGPQFASATYADAVVTVTFTGGQGSLANATDTTGWVVTDDGTPITVNSAAANGTNKVDLTLASAPTGTVLVSFCSGDTGEGATLSDSGTYPLPPEPIVGQTVTEAASSVAMQFVHYMRARQAG